MQSDEILVPIPEKNWVSGEELMKLYELGAHAEICDRLFKLCQGYETFGYTTINPIDQERIDDTVSVILFIFTRREFQIPLDIAAKMVTINHLLANLIASSSYQTADLEIQHLLNQKDNLFKLLVLYSVRCKRVIDQDTLFRLQPALASVWWVTYGTGVGAAVNTLLWENMQAHYSKVPEGFQLPDIRIVPPIFDCTYYNPDCDGIIKRELNKQAAKFLPEYKSLKQPVSGKIAWVTGRWFPTSSVYRCSKPYLEKLIEKYSVTLINIGPPHERLDIAGFTDVIYLPTKDNHLELAALKDADFEMAIFPDVGMSNESTILSNIRLAPIMLCLYGHASSTFSTQMDYWMGGTDLEVAELAHKHYSERLMLVPGLGMSPVYPDYQLKGLPHDPNRFVINCAWTSNKLSYPTCQAMLDIRNRAKRPLLFKIFPAFTLGRYNSLWPTIKALSDMFGDEVTIMQERSYEEYMQEMELGDLSLMAHPFGGYTTVVDAFILGQPVVAVEGERMFNRMAPAMLRQVGLPQFIAKDLNEYVDITVNLINNPGELKAASEHLMSLDLRTLLAEQADAGDLVKVVDCLRANDALIRGVGDPGPFYLDRRFPLTFESFNGMIVA
jgi:hypothetical protein